MSGITLSSDQVRCFTSRYNSRSNVLANEVKIQEWDNPESKARIVTATALWDTGATNTVMRPEVIAQLGISPFSYTRISTPSGNKDCGQYYINVDLPNEVRIRRIPAIEAIPSNCDVLIGMDIIGLGDFAVTNHDGKTAFSFRMPSIQEIDFAGYTYRPVKTVDEPGRNDPCPCGSGKKYKRCCGKNK
ncbi:MAG: SEC-C domain-containing protein [Synergistaceae bacterium]|jgi:predicted aspartyl protease|nr:SEC-C domain-containing protein [Synergistaceae bacterium]